MTCDQPNTDGLQTTDVEVPRTNEELVTKLSSQLNAAVETLQQLENRRLHVTANLIVADGKWEHRLSVHRTTYL